MRNNSAYAESGVRLIGNVWLGFYEQYFVGNQAQAYAAAGGFATDGPNVYLDRCLIAGNQANLNGGTANAGEFLCMGWFVCIFLPMHFYR